MDAKINDLFLLAPTTDDADHKLYNYDWDKKSDKIFFRGGIYCHPPENIRENLEKARGAGRSLTWLLFPHFDRPALSPRLRFWPAGRRHLMLFRTSLRTNPRSTA